MVIIHDPIEKEITKTFKEKNYKSALSSNKSLTN